jgi:hypothetical protein
LLLIDQHRYDDASEALNVALRLDPQNLDAWKARIWVSVITQNCDDALATMERLCKKMPDENVPADCERKCREFAAFMGQICGYLSGPGRGRLDPVTRSVFRQAIGSHLADARKECFVHLSQRVMDDYTARMQEIDELREQARQGEVTYRNQRLVCNAQDRHHTWRELGSIESLRSESRALAANERNVHAATRERSGGSFGSHHASHYDDPQETVPFPCPNPNDPNRDNNDPDERNQHVDQYGASGGGYFKKRGLDDRHYADVNRREKEYDNYLRAKQRRLRQQHRRIAQEQEELLRRPVVGHTRQLAYLENQASALATYVELPVSPQAQVERILDSFPAREPALEAVAAAAR